MHKWYHEIGIKFLNLKQHKWGNEEKGSKGKMRKRQDFLNRNTVAQEIALRINKHECYKLKSSFTAKKSCHMWGNPLRMGKNFC